MKSRAPFWREGQALLQHETLGKRFPEPRLAAYNIYAIQGSPL
jgi:hypothetical protein